MDDVVVFVSTLGGVQRLNLDRSGRCVEFGPPVGGCPEVGFALITVVVAGTSRLSGAAHLPVISLL